MKTRAFATALLAVLALAGCLNLEQPYPEREFFLLETQRPLPSSAMPTSAIPASARQAGSPSEVLLVRRLSISPAFEAPNLAYKKVDGTYESDPYRAFFVSPQAMLTECVREWLDAAEFVDAVVDTGSHLEPTLVLEGSVQSFFGDYTASGAPEAVLALQFLLVRRAEGASQVLCQHDYRLREPAEDTGAAALVAAWERALASALDQLEVDLRRELGR